MYVRIGKWYCLGSVYTFV